MEKQKLRFFHATIRRRNEELTFHVTSGMLRELPFSWIIFNSVFVPPPREGNL